MGLPAFCLAVLLLLFMKLGSLYEIVTADHLSFTHSLPATCHDDEKSALLQFRFTFIIDKSASAYEGAYPKVLQWNMPGGQRSSNCCSWDGVECDDQTGHVIGLDLSSSYLHGPIDSNNTLFRLVYLERLNLADNHFNYSQIPSAVGQLSKITHLNLSNAAFSGQIPYEISQLSTLSSLDLSLNCDENTGKKFLEIENPNHQLRGLVQNLTSLESLNLECVKISSTVPDILANFTSLTSLILTDCELQGEFSAKIFQLPNLQFLHVGLNENLTGHLPEFFQASPLKELALEYCRFSGGLPSSIQKLESLELLMVGQNYFSGPIPSSLGKLTKLTKLSLGENSLSGPIPSSLRNLTLLNVLDINSNQMIGPLPSWLGNLSQLSSLVLYRNKFHGSIPMSFSKLMNLKFLSLSDNNLGGIVKFDMFFNMKSLTGLQISHNDFSLLFEKGNVNATLPKFKTLGLSSCNLIEFPDFLRHQNKLETLIIGSNMIQGPLPVLPPSIRGFLARNNMLTGEISPLYCTLSSLSILDLSSNKLSGTILPCLGKSGGSLSVLNLRNNSLHGIIPEICKNGENLTIVDLSYNQLQGRLPRSMSSCKMLQVLAVSNNQLNDVFPSWLGTLPELRILSLRGNRFHGIIGKPDKKSMFPMLQVIDMSCNKFTGELPSQYIFSWNSMKTINMNVPIFLTYMKTTYSLTKNGSYYTGIFFYFYAITITYKGTERFYELIHDRFAAIDLSSNRFEGKIHVSIGNLRALHSLNLSSNMLTGPIPSSLENLKELESLDISHNNLTGSIPQQLVELRFLELFNVSHNNLKGPIPQANQFGAFDNSSYEGNPGLCGAPLTKKCVNPQLLSTTSSGFEGDDDSETGLRLDRKFVLAGYVSGFVVGVVLSDFVITRMRKWWIKIPFKRRRERRDRIN